jgi:hypothetical protein
VSASSGKWRGAKHAGIYSREGFDFGIGGSRSARRQRGVREQLDKRRDMEDARLEVVGTRRYTRGGKGVLVVASW